jgi:hypothetical protein
MNQTEVSRRTYVVSTICTHNSVLKSRSVREKLAVATAKATKAAAEAGEAVAAEASCQVSLAFKPIRESVGDVMQPSREVYEGYTEATGLPGKSSDYFEK